MARLQAEEASILVKRSMERTYAPGRVIRPGLALVLRDLMQADGVSKQDQYSSSLIFSPMWWYVS